MKNVFKILLVLTIVFISSCSNDNNSAVFPDDESLSNIDIESVAKQFGEYTEEVLNIEPVETILSVDSLIFETEEDLVKFFEKRGIIINIDAASSVPDSTHGGISTKNVVVPIKPGVFHYTSRSSTSYTSRTKSKATMYMLDNSAANYIGRSAGSYLVYTYSVQLKLASSVWEYPSKTLRWHFKDFFWEDSPNCGYINSIWSSGYIAVSGKERGYSQTILADGSIELQTNVIEVVSDRNGSKVNKWIPCHLDDIVWNYGRMMTHYINYP